MHYSAVVMPGFRTLMENTEVEFDLEPSGKGFLALQVRPCAVPVLNAQCNEGPMDDAV